MFIKFAIMVGSAAWSGTSHKRMFHTNRFASLWGQRLCESFKYYCADI